MKPSSILSLGAIAAVFLLGTSYLMFSVVRVDWFHQYTAISMTLTNSGSLGTRSPILLSGVKVGNVTAVDQSADGVRVTFRVDNSYRIPVASTARIENLSTLGEPYVEFTPTVGGGPYLRAGHTISTRAIDMPVSIPDVSRTVTGLLDQLHPEAISSIVDTVDQALAGTDSVVPQLARSTNLLAATILSRSGTIRNILTRLQNLATDMSWLGPSAAAAGPRFAELGVKADDIIAVLGRFARERDVPSDYTTGSGLQPFLDKLTNYVRQIGPVAKQLEPTIAPLAATAGAAFPRIDLSALITQALNTVDADGGIRLQIDVK